jgi:hypothetical protein
MENNVKLKFVGSNGVPLEEEFNGFALNLDCKKEKQTITLTGSYVKPALLEEHHCIVQSLSEGETILELCYDNVVVELEELMLKFTFRGVSWDTLDYESGKGKVKLIFNFNSMKPEPLVE